MSEPGCRRPFIASREFWLGAASSLLGLAVIISAFAAIAEWFA